MRPRIERPTKPKDQVENQRAMQESKLAIQKPSEGRRLEQPSNWQFFLHPFKWLAAIFASSRKTEDIPEEALLHTLPLPKTHVKILTYEREGRMHITNAQTKETRTLDEDHSLKAQKKAIAELKKGVEETTNESIEDFEIADWIKRGNIYYLEDSGTFYLSLCPRLMDLPRAAFLDRTPLVDLYKLIKEGKSGTFEMPISPFLIEKVEMRLIREKESYRITLKHGLNSYTLVYDQELLDPLELEKDLLLARSFFLWRSR